MKIYFPPSKYQSFVSLLSTTYFSEGISVQQQILITEIQIATSNFFLNPSPPPSIFLRKIAVAIPYHFPEAKRHY